IDLSWTASAGTGTITYHIERGTDNRGFAKIATTTSTTYTDTGLTLGTDYWYRIRATDQTPNSVPSTYSNHLEVSTVTPLVPGLMAFFSMNENTGGTTYANYTGSPSSISGNLNGGA